jgi:parallel beta-helix repeat protein
MIFRRRTVRRYIALIMTISLLSTVIFIEPSVEAKVTVNSVTVTTDKIEYTLGSEAIAIAQLDYTGSKKDLLGVNFTWYYPNGSLAKFDPLVMPDGSGASYSSWWPDELGMNFVVNATYSGDESKFDETNFDVVLAPPSNLIFGSIGINTTWTLAQSPYIVIGDVFVESGVTLTIEPGVVIEFFNNTILMVNGTLFANGNSTNMITFTSNNTNPKPGDWVGIDFNFANSNSKISYCRIEYAHNGINIYESSPKIVNNLIRDINRTGISAYRSSSYIGNNTITNIVYGYASNKGINLISECDVTIENNVISDVEEYGIKVTNSNPQILSNYISGSLYNIECVNSNATIINNTLFDATDSIRIVSSQDVLIENNDIFQNSFKGIRIESSSVKIIDNYIFDCGDQAIWIYKSQNSQIIGNLLMNNDVGIELRLSDTIFVDSNEILDCLNDGIISEDSNELVIDSNTVDGGENGIFLQDSENMSIHLNYIINNSEKGLYFYNTSNIQIENNEISQNAVGIYLLSSDAWLKNSTIASSSNWDVHLFQNSNLTSINSTFDGTRVIVAGTCLLIVKNYLHVFVQNQTFQSLKDAKVDVIDGNNTIYSDQTNEKGYLGFLLITDRIYLGSNTPVENTTVVEVIHDSTFFENNPRTIDMSYSHVEVFGVGNPLSISIELPENQTLAFDDINISGSSENQGADDVIIQISIDGGDWIFVNYSDLNKWWLSLDTTNLTDGEHVITARISNDFFSMEDSITILVDNIGNKPPELSITSHKSQDIVNGSFVLIGTAFDYDGLVESVDVKVDGEQWIAANNLGGNWSNWSFEIDSTDYSNGTYNISVMAVDNATESRIIFIELVFRNNESDIIDPNGNNSHDTNQTEEERPILPLLFVVIPLILSILLYALVKWKKDEEEEDEMIDDDEIISDDDILENGKKNDIEQNLENEVETGKLKVHEEDSNEKLD